MRKILFIICALFISLSAGAHSGKATYHIIIDTDGAADDLRAISMLLSSREVETLAITTSEGALTPAATAEKVTALLYHFHHEGIPVGVGRALNIAPPPWRQQSEQISWGSPSTTQTVVEDPVSGKQFRNAVELIIETIEVEKEKITFFCFGTLTNLNDVLTAKPHLKERIERVIWYNSSANPLRGSNYDADRASAHSVLGSVTVEIVSGE